MSHPRSRLSKAKILILGGPGVGKTAFAVRYLTRRFIGDYDPNKEMTYTTKVLVDRDEVALEILDTANDNNDTLLEAHVRWADGFVLMYSVTDRESYKKVLYFHNLIKHYRKGEDGLPVVMIANKTDLNHARLVSEEEGTQISQKFDCPIYEISISESRAGVFDAMDEILRQIKREYVRAQSASDKKQGTFMNVKRVLKRKIYRSRSDTF